MSNKREHKRGQRTAYETDGESYWLAPLHVDAWGPIHDQERALNATLETVVKTVAEARRSVQAQARRWWDDVYRDLDLDRSVTYTFDRMEGKLSPVSKNGE